MKPDNNFTIKNRYHETRLFRNRLFIAIILACLFSLLIITRLLYLQVFQYQYFTTLSKSNEIDIIPLPPKRGIIYDRNGILLAQNIPVFSLVVTPSKVSHLKQTITKIRKIIPLSENDLDQFYKQLKQHRRFDEIPLKLKITETDVARFSLERYRFPGITIKAELIRDYPLSNALAHVLGYVGRINEQELTQVNTTNYARTNFIGKIGIEKYYEPLLHGTVGYRKEEIDATGQVVRKLQSSPSTRGSDLYLTIDSHLQIAAERALKDQRGAVVVIAPDTGEILALASQPTYNPNMFINNISHKNYTALQKDTTRPLYNRTIRGLYAPGSVIKPFIALAGLDAELIKTHSRIFDPGWYQLPGIEHIYHDWKKTGHGFVNVKTALIQSCDTFFYTLAHKLGIKRLAEILDRFGFGKATGIDIGEELPGTLPTPEWKLKHRGEHWYSGDTVLSGIGQGFLQTSPLQLATATAFLAMRGERFQPHLLQAVQTPHQPKKQIPPISLDPIILNHPKVWDVVISAMTRVISQGTGFRFGQTSYTVAAKTGTAQVISHTYDLQDQSTFIPIAWRNNSVFIAFAPVQNPKIAVAVVIENNKIAPNVARKVFDAYFYTLKKKVPHKKHSPTHTKLEEGSDDKIL